MCFLSRFVFNLPYNPNELFILIFSYILVAKEYIRTSGQAGWCSGNIVAIFLYAFPTTTIDNIAGVTAGHRSFYTNNFQRMKDLLQITR